MIQFTVHITMCRVNFSLLLLYKLSDITTNSLVSLHSSLTHITEPRAKQGIDILFPASVKYSLNLMTDEHTESTEKFKLNLLTKIT